MAAINDDQLVERLVPKILSSIRAKAKAVETIPVAQDLTGITSIPCYDTTGEQFKKVLVPLDALKEPAFSAGEAAADAAERARAATTEAKTSALEAKTAAEDAAAAAIAAEQFAGKIVVISEKEYEEAAGQDILDPGKLYFAYEE